MIRSWYAGLMTGTVLDGQIDVALLRTDGEQIAEFGPFDLVPYAPEVNALLQHALGAARDWNFDGPEPAIFAEAEHALTLAQADAVRLIADRAGLNLFDIASVGFHGQTVLHRAPSMGSVGKSRQLGDGHLMANQLGIPIVYDFRSADIAAGGQGAPLCAAYHGALLDRGGAGEDTAVLNLGGVANLSWKSADGRLIAFDTGPANAPINDWVKALGLGDMDLDGALAAQGRVDEARLTTLLDHPYMLAPFPKSLDRFDFSADMAAGCSAEDGAALLTAFSAAAAAAGLAQLPTRPSRLIISGGGRYNKTLIEEIGRRSMVEIINADHLGWRGDAIEAECFAFLAARSQRKLPLSYPDTTGVLTPTLGGIVAAPQPI